MGLFIKLIKTIFLSLGLYAPCSYSFVTTIIQQELDHQLYKWVLSETQLQKKDATIEPVFTTLCDDSNHSTVTDCHRSYDARLRAHHILGKNNMAHTAETSGSAGFTNFQYLKNKDGDGNYVVYETPVRYFKYDCTEENPEVVIGKDEDGNDITGTINSITPSALESSFDDDELIADEVNLESEDVENSFSAQKGLLDMMKSDGDSE